MKKILFITGKLTKAEVYLIKQLREKMDCMVEILLIQNHNAEKNSLGRSLQKWRMVDRRLQPMKLNPSDISTETFQDEINFRFVKRDELGAYDFAIGSDKEILQYVPENSAKALIWLEEPYNLVEKYLSGDKSIPVPVFFKENANLLKCEVLGVYFNEGLLNSYEKFIWYRTLAVVKFIKNYSFYSRKAAAYCQTKFKLQTGKVYSHYLNKISYLLKRKGGKGTYNWKLAVQKDGGEISMVEQPAGTFWADPFVVTDAGKRYVFFEELHPETGKGEIACGTLEGNRFVDKKTVLADSTHYSFPNVFRMGEDWFMLPENSEKKEAAIYRATEFPYKWEKFQVIMQKPLVDTVFTVQDNKTFLFANLIHEFELDNNDTLYIWYSDDIFSNKWTEHAMNPVVCTREGSRNAGDIIKDEEMLKRPSQNSAKTYGESISIKRIKKLTATEYEEEQCSLLKPSANYVGLHTVNKLGDITVFDYLVHE